MDILAAWIVAGIAIISASVTAMTYAFKAGGMARMVKDHDDWIKGQPERCKIQKGECAKNIQYNRDQIDKLRNLKKSDE
jgi:hypothetical protein